jgi:hypothetical protein
MATEKAGRTTDRVTDDGNYFTTHQRPDLRWIYRLDGQDSEKTYPTAGEAERGAIAALRAARPKNDIWKLLMILAVASLPVVYVLRFVVGMLTGK